MPDETPEDPRARRERRGFRRLSLAESIKLQVVDAPAGSPATFGSTIDLSRGGLEAVVQGALIPVGARCVVRFLSSTQIKPEMVWGRVVDVDQTADGTTVRVEFESPLESVKLTPADEPPPAEDVDVLVVDDDRGVREVLRRFLTREGYRVRTAADGHSGLEALRERVPDVVLLDIYMPRRNGLEVLADLRREGIAPQVVITISGQADHESARRSLRLGAHDFLVKPIDLKYLDWAIQLRL